MRIGEIKSIVQRAVNADSIIVIESSTIYGGQAYLVQNYGEIMDALEVLADQPWNELNFSGIEEIKSKYRSGVKSIQLGQEDFGYLKNYVSTLNRMLPIYLGIAETLIPDQAENVINIRLPDNIKTLTRLIKLQFKIDKLFKEYVIDGDFEFQGFDMGSDWLIVSANGEETYRVFVGCLKVAQDFFKTRVEYFKSEQARIEYIAAQKLYGRQYDETDFEKFKELRMEAELESQLNGAINKVDKKDDSDDDELEVRILKATKDLVGILGEGVEFHVSLNPPSFVSEENGGLKIDYKKLQELSLTERKIT